MASHLRKAVALAELMKLSSGMSVSYRGSSVDSITCSASREGNSSATFYHLSVRHKVRSYASTR